MKLFRVAEAAALAGVRYDTMRQWVHRNQLELVLVDNVPLVTYDELLRILQERAPEKALELEAAESFSDFEPIENED